MPFSGNDWTNNRVVASEELIGLIRRAHPDFAPMPRLSASGHNNDTEKLWGVPGNEGRVGFISSMTDAFCGTCNRLRLTADGSLKVCLHGSDELSLRDLMRSGVDDEGLSSAILSALSQKHAALGGNRDMHGIAGAVRSGSLHRPMVRIGG